MPKNILLNIEGDRVSATYAGKPLTIVSAATFAAENERAIIKLVRDSSSKNSVEIAITKEQKPTGRMPMNEYTYSIDGGELITVKPREQEKEKFKALGTLYRSVEHAEG